MKVAWRECRDRESNDSLNQKLITKLCGLSKDATDLWNLGIDPIISSSKNTGLVLPKGSASPQLPNSSKPNSLDDSWTFALYDKEKLRFDSVWNLQLWASTHKITAHQGTEKKEKEKKKNLGLVS